MKSVHFKAETKLKTC